VVIDDDDFRLALAERRGAAELADEQGGVVPAAVVDDDDGEARQGEAREVSDGAGTCGVMSAPSVERSSPCPNDGRV